MNATPADTARLRVESATIGYDRRTISEHLSVAIPDGDDLSGRPVDEVSGGQRQRVWVAMALAQHTDIMLLDEPTTFLDITHQIELMELFTDVHHAGHTLVAEGTPDEVVTAELVEEVFGLRCLVVPDPVAGSPQVVPLGRERTRRRSADDTDMERATHG